MGWKTNRRGFLKLGAGVTCGAASPLLAPSRSAAGKNLPDRGSACLVDTTLCIGCLQCEAACREVNRLPSPAFPPRPRSPQPVHRRPDATAFTVVNTVAGAPTRGADETRTVTHVKVQCMHCLDAACVSSCIVGALRVNGTGAVVYDADRCIGCRYCLIACPFEIPAYEYADPVEPRVRKCTFCADGGGGTDAVPACARVCPVEAIVYGRRADLIELAEARLQASPDRYLPHVYGRTEAGGTSWLVLAGQPFSNLGLPDLPGESPARLTEAIQHGVFRWGAAPAALFGALATLMWWRSKKREP